MRNRQPRRGPRKLGKLVSRSWSCKPEKNAFLPVDEASRPPRVLDERLLSATSEGSFWLPRFRGSTYTG
eukprot:1188808-Prorocentrum_minimum.AAC.6